MANINFLNANTNDITKQHMNAINNKKIVTSGPDQRVLENMSEINRRLKLLETSLRTLRSKVETLEKNQIENNKDNRRDIRTLEQENDEIHTNMREVKDHVKLIATEMQNAAKEEDLKVIKNYLNLWNPVKFTSQNQVKKIAKDVFEEMQREQARTIRRLDKYKQ